MNAARSADAQDQDPLLGDLVLLLVLLAAARGFLFSGPLLVHDELGIALLSVPLETSEVGTFA